MYPNILSLISFLIFAIYLSIGIYILKLSPESKLNRSVFILSVMFAIWAFAYTFFYSAPDQASAWFWYKLSAFGRCAYPAGLLQIALILTRNDKIFKKWYHYILLYVPAIFFIYETVTGSFTGPGLVWINSQWIDIATSWWYSSYMVYFTVLPVLSYLLIWLWGRRSESPREKKQGKIIVLTAIVAFIPGYIVNAVLPFINIFVLPSIGQIIALIAFTGIGYAISRYKFLQMTPDIAVDEIISRTTDMIIFLNRRGEIVNINEQAERILGYTKKEIIGTKWTVLLPKEHIKPVERKIVDMIHENAPEKQYIEMDLNYLTLRNEKIPVKMYFSVIRDEYEIRGRLIVAQDMRQTEKLENEIKAKEKALDEKEMLMKEIHHRVKNNLTVISSLLSLQSRYIQDDETKSMFKESQNRARSMALIHERLYKSDNLKSIDFGNYIGDLASELFRTYSLNNGNVKLNVDVDNEFLDVDVAVPLGIIVNEIISNSLKYAFIGNKKGYISIQFHREEDKFVLNVEDNGNGIPENFNYKNSDSLGIKLINSLVEQIEGKMEVKNDNGTCFKIIFKETVY
ncbi:sensor histidine kinase [Methanobacterium aggregans]|uniref:sensor histidine kinase n=1 Tax=Methanobacterium aggregans TaxID=1615586 RepID=UPI00320DB5C4